MMNELKIVANLSFKICHIFSFFLFDWEEALARWSLSEARQKRVTRARIGPTHWIDENRSTSCKDLPYC